MIFREEKDTMGTVRVPENAYYGAQTQRAVENFPISGLKFPLIFEQLYRACHPAYLVLLMLISFYFTPYIKNIY